MGALNRIHDENIHVIGKSIVVWNKLYKHDLFDNIRFPVGKRYEDDFTTYKIFYEINKLVSTDIILYAYVQRKNSIMNQKFSIKRLDALEAFDNYVEFFNTLSDRQLFKNCLLRYLRILVKILNELYESDYEGKKEIEEILKNKFEQIYELLEEFPDDSTSIRPDNTVQSKHFYYKEFYNIINSKK